jgi:regulator of RNase E activity RraA/3-hydroxyisobutyrate dehydrogenase-like beta-hydroxyacid dehydrogenase
MHVAIIGLGEAGSLYGEAAAEMGWRVTGFDPMDVPTPEGVERAASVAEAVDGADVVLGLTGAKASVAVAAEAATAVKRGVCYADLNASSGALKQEISAVLDGSSALLADVSVVGSVPEYGAKTPLIASGPGSDAATQLFVALGAPVENIGGAAGEASTRKLVRSGFMKGLAALIIETVETGKAAGLDDWTRAQVAGQLVGGEKTLDRLYDSTYKHAARRAREMEAASDLIAELGLVPLMAPATAALHQQLGEVQTVVGEETMARWSNLPVANIGDARERLGITTGLAAPWEGATLIGRARTVLTAGGDNLGIQHLVQNAREGDVIVVDGQADTSRALVGELIAGRLMAKGVRGMVIDGAFRDAEDLQAMGFPIWCRARSAAGPYKNGPYRHGVPAAIGGVVCHEGDLVIADGDGVTFVRPAEAPALLTASRAVQDEEASRRRSIDEQVAQFRATRENRTEVA